MSKELTEQWRNGTLKDGWYYVKEDGKTFISPCSNHHLLAVLKDCKVLAPVPSYEIYFKSEHTLRRCKRWINMMCVGGPATDVKKKLLEQIEECLRGLNDRE